MDRPDPAPPAPGGSSSAPTTNPTGTAPAPAPAPVPAAAPASGTQQASVPGPESPTSRPSDPEREDLETPNPQRPIQQVSVPVATPTAEPAQQPAQQVSVTAAAPAAEPTQQPAQQVPPAIPAAEPTQQPAQQTSEPVTSLAPGPTQRPVTPGRRPTTGSTLGGTSNNPHQMSNPPTPPPLPRPPLPQLQTVRPATARTVSAAGASMDRLEDAETLSGHPGPNDMHRDSAYRTNQPLPALPQARLAENGALRRQRTLDAQGMGSAIARRSGIDWIVPVDQRKRTVGERIQPTLDVAMREREKYANKARMTGYALNIAIGLQVILGSLTTGLSAVATTGRQTAVQTTVLGGLATLVASYLARARGSNEPELSIVRVKDLERFIREVQAFQLDHGHLDGDDYDKKLDQFRHEFEELLGNASGERKLSKPV